jgi:hypothetical protein
MILDAIFAQTSQHELLTSSQFHWDRQSVTNITQLVDVVKLFKQTCATNEILTVKKVGK